MHNCSKSAMVDIAIYFSYISSIAGWEIMDVHALVHTRMVGGYSDASVTGKHTSVIQLLGSGFWAGLTR